MFERAAYSERRERWAEGVRRDKHAEATMFAVQKIDRRPLSDRSGQGFLASVLAFGLTVSAAQAQVHFGGNVYIGGHNVSHQTFDRQRRGEFYLYDRQPHPAGCVWRRNGDGSRTKVCRFRSWR